MTDNERMRAAMLKTHLDETKVGDLHEYENLYIP